MTLATGQDLLANELRDVYSAEQLLSRELQRFSKQVSSDEVREKLEERLEEGKNVLEAVERGLEEMNVAVRRKKNQAVEGLIEDAKQLTEQIESDDLFDAALIAEVQKFQHYCMAAWGTIAAYAREMEQRPLVDAMERALENGKRLDEELTELAEEDINPEIFAEAEEEEELDQEERQENGRERGQKVKSSTARASRGEERQRQMRSAKEGHKGGDESSRRGKRVGNGHRGSDSLRGREYRDRKGELHHHTKSYMERRRSR